MLTTGGPRRSGRERGRKHRGHAHRHFLSAKTPVSPERFRLTGRSRRSALRPSPPISPRTERPQGGVGLVMAAWQASRLSTQGFHRPGGHKESARGNRGWEKACSCCSETQEKKPGAYGAAAWMERARLAFHKCRSVFGMEGEAPSLQRFKFSAFLRSWRPAPRNDTGLNITVRRTWGLYIARHVIQPSHRHVSLPKTLISHSWLRKSRYIVFFWMVQDQENARLDS